jgi:hypothetical protein
MVTVALHLISEVSEKSQDYVILGPAVVETSSIRMLIVFENWQVCHSQGIIRTETSNCV